MVNCFSALLKSSSATHGSKEPSHTVVPPGDHENRPSHSMSSTVTAPTRVDGHDGLGFCASCGPTEPLPQYGDEPMTDYGIYLSSGKGGILDNLKSDIQAHIQSLDAELREVSLKMWDNPEIAWKEHKTHDLFVKYLQGKDGWKVTPHAHGLDTAYRAEFVSNSGNLSLSELPVIGFNSEMDALAGIGHACGHNLIAIAGVAASLAVAHALVKNNVPGRVVLLGTPAEEAYGGKINLLKAGAYKDMSACLMVHPAPMDSVGAMLAVSHVYASYKGQTAHAGAQPWEGINAQDAGVLAYNNISALRQQIRPDCRVHGIIQGRNWSANVIPGDCDLTYNVRAPNVTELEALTKRVIKCLKAGAEATGCSVDIKLGSTYYDVANNKALAEAYRNYMTQEHNRNIQYITFPASSDFGNVTYALPSMHAEYAIPLKDPRREGNHTVGFAAAAKTREAHTQTLQAAGAIGTVAARIVADADFRKGVTEQWKRWKDDQPKNRSDGSTTSMF